MPPRRCAAPWRAWEPDCSRAPPRSSRRASGTRSRRAWRSVPSRLQTDSMKHWHETREVLDFLARVRGEGKRAALATVVRVRGSAYRHEGAKLVVAEDGSTAGNVSGGLLEQDVREVALLGIRAGES